MNTATKTIAILYCCALLVAVSFAPYSWWNPAGYQFGKVQGYYFVFTAPKDTSSIDKGKLAMEIVGLTVLAAGALVIARINKE